MTSRSSMCVCVCVGLSLDRPVAFCMSHVVLPETWLLPSRNPPFFSIPCEVHLDVLWPSFLLLSTLYWPANMFFMAFWCRMHGNPLTFSFDGEAAFSFFHSDIYYAYFEAGSRILRIKHTTRMTFPVSHLKYYKKSPCQN